MFSRIFLTNRTVFTRKLALNNTSGACKSTSGVNKHNFLKRFVKPSDEFDTRWCNIYRYLGIQIVYLLASRMSADKQRIDKDCCCSFHWNKFYQRRKQNNSEHLFWQLITLFQKLMNDFPHMSWVHSLSIHYRLEVQANPKKIAQKKGCYL